MIWINDTQNLHGGHANAFDAMIDWILLSRDELNTVCVLHTGDVVGSRTRNYQLEHARYLLCRIVNADIPLLVINGNHDIGSAEVYGPYKEMIAGLMDDNALYRGGEAGYVLVSAGGTDFVIAGIGYGRTDDPEAMQWLYDTYALYPERVGILIQHSYMHDNGSLTGAGLDTQPVIAGTPSLRLVLCGHLRGAGRRADGFDDDGDGVPERTVNQLMSNYQNRLEGGGGWLRMLTFDPVTRDIAVSTYSPLQDDWSCFMEELECFVLTDAF